MEKKDYSIFEILSINEPLTLEQAKNMLYFLVDSIKNQIFFLLLLGKIIDDLLLEKEFSNSFFEKFDYYKSEILKTNNQKLILIFNELSHNFQERNQEKLGFKTKKERVFRYMEILNNLKNNEISKTISINQFVEILNNRFNNKEFAYFGFELEIDLDSINIKEINLFFLDFILDNIIINYQRYGKNGKLKISFNEDNFELEFSNEIKTFDQEIYNEFKNDFPENDKYKFSKNYYKNLLRIPGYYNWVIKNGHLIDNFDDEENVLILLYDFFDNYFSKYVGNINFSKKDIEDLYLSKSQEYINNYKILLDFKEYMKSTENNKIDFINYINFVVNHWFYYILDFGDNPQGLGKGNGIVKQTVEGIFEGDVNIKRCTKKYFFKASGLKYN